MSAYLHGFGAHLPERVVTNAELAERLSCTAEWIEKFKGKLGRNAIYHTYTDMRTFEEAFRQHLAGVMNELLAKHESKLE